MLDAWDELTDLGSDARLHVKEQVTQAQQLVNDVLHAVGDVAGDRCVMSAPWLEAWSS